MGCKDIFMRLIFINYGCIDYSNKYIKKNILNKWNILAMSHYREYKCNKMWKINMYLKSKKNDNFCVMHLSWPIHYSFLYHMTQLPFFFIVVKNTRLGAKIVTISNYVSRIIKVIFSCKTVVKSTNWYAAKWYDMYK